MESRSFIKAAAALMLKIRTGVSPLASPEEEQQHHSGVQKELNQLFGGLGNPTLPSAYRLRDLALEEGYAVDPRVLQRLSQFEYLS